MEKCIARDLNPPNLRVRDMPPFCSFSPPFHLENYWDKSPGKILPYGPQQQFCFPILNPSDPKMQLQNGPPSKKRCLNNYLINPIRNIQQQRPKHQLNNIILPQQVPHIDRQDIMLNKDILIPPPLNFSYPNSPPVLTPPFVPNWLALGRMVLNYKLLQQQLLNFPAPLAGVPSPQITSPDPLQYGSLYYKHFKDILENKETHNTVETNCSKVNTTKIFKPENHNNTKKDTKPLLIFQPKRNPSVNEHCSITANNNHTWSHSKPVFKFESKSEIESTKKANNKYITSLKHPGVTSLKDKKSHKCIYCGKLYSRKYGLKIHIRTHTGYKPLKCKVCGRPFGDPSNLNKHVRLHAQGETPYRCDYCGKVLVRRRDLERHIKSRHPEQCPDFVINCPPADPRLWSKS